MIEFKNYIKEMQANAVLTEKADAHSNGTHIQIHLMNHSIGLEYFIHL